MALRTFLTPALALLCTLSTPAMAAPPGLVAPAEGGPAAAAGHNILVLRENGVGSATTAQQYIDALMARVAQVNGWSGARGVYHTKREAAQQYIATAKPEYGFLSLAAFLSLRRQAKLKVVGQVEVEGGGGLKYFIVSKTETDLATCKGKRLVTNHASDKSFIDKVVAAGAFALSEFKLEVASRPIQTLKKVLRGEADCALIDDAQMAELARLEGAEQVHSVWVSAPLPPMPVVAFDTVPADAAKGFVRGLGKVCEGDGAQACAAAGIKALKPAEEAAYRSLIKAYKP